MNDTITTNFSKWLNLMGIPHIAVNQNFTVGVAEMRLNIRPTFKITNTTRDKYILIHQGFQINHDIFFEEFKNVFGDIYVIEHNDISFIMQNAKVDEFKIYLGL